MKYLTLENIANACDGILMCKEEELRHKEVSNVVIDSRKVTQDNLFIAIKGNRVDGHSFINNAYESGALCVVTEMPLESDKPYIIVRDSLVAVREIAKFYRQGLTTKVIGITGSVGKTSTKEMIASVLSQKYTILKTEGNFNNELGLPLTIFKIREEHEIAVLEMGISDFDEMTRLSSIARPDVALITNIGQCHLEKLKSRDGVFMAKTEMFKNLQENASIILNGDDDKLIGIDRYNNIKPVFYYVENIQDKKIYADNIVENGMKSVQCNLHYYNSDIPVTIHMPGKHMVYSALAAACIGKMFKLSDKDIQTGIEKIQSSAGRNNIMNIGSLTVIDDSYNANPASMKAGIDILSFAKGRKVALVGDMLELGSNEDLLHGEIGIHLIERGIDVIVMVGNHMRFAFKELFNNNSNRRKIFYFDNLDDMIPELHRIVQPKDTVLVKASHGMHFEKIIEYLQKFPV